MHPCVRCHKKVNCPDKCYPKRDYERHMNRINRKLRSNRRKAEKHEQTTV